MRIIRIFLMFVGALATLAVAGVVAAVFFLATRSEPVPEKTVLTLDLDRNVGELGGGGLTALTHLRGAPLTLWETVDAIERAARDKHVAGMVARVGASGMGLARIQELRDAVSAFRRSGKPTYAFAESFGDFGPGNGAYYLAAAFEYVYLQPSGDVGLTGLLAESYFLKGTLEKLGVRPRLNQREEYKGVKELFTESGFTGPQREAVGRILESLTEQLTAGISEGRGLSRASVRDLMQQAPFSAREALKADLVDGLRYRDQVDEVVRYALGNDIEFLPLTDYRRRVEDTVEDTATVALIHGLGRIHRGRSRHQAFAGAHSMGSDTVARAFRRAADDKDVHAIIFRIDSPGGSYVASDVIRREVVRARRRGKPVVVSMGNVAGSGGYFVAAPANRIVAEPGTLTGSIGVAAGKVVTNGLWEKLGVSWDHTAGNTNATFWSSVRDYDPAQQQRLEHLLDAVYDDFVFKVANGRKLSREQVLEAAKGRVWTGADAKENGLVDELGGYAATMRAVRKAAGIKPETAIELRSFPRRKSPLQLLIGQLMGDEAAQIRYSATDLFRGAAERLAPLALRALEDRSGRPGLLEMKLPDRLR